MMNLKLVTIFLSGFALLTACASPTASPATPTPLGLPPATFFPAVTTTSQVPLPTSAVGTTAATLPATQSSGSPNLCADPQATALIDSFKTAVTRADGPLLSSLVSPAGGIDVSYYHSGTAIHYDQNQAKFLFETRLTAYVLLNNLTNNQYFTFGSISSNTLTGNGGVERFVVPAQTVAVYGGWSYRYDGL